MRLTEAQIRRIVNEALNPKRYEPQYNPGERARLKPFIKRLMESVEEEIKNCPEVKIYRDLGYGEDLPSIVSAVECIPRSSPGYISIMRILERIWDRWNTDGLETTPFPTFDELLEVEGSWKLKMHPDTVMVGSKRPYITGEGRVTREEAMLIRLPQLWRSLRIPKAEGRP